MILLSFVGSAMGQWLRRVMLALAQPAPDSEREVSQEYYRFPPF